MFRIPQRDVVVRFRTDEQRDEIQIDSPLKALLTASRNITQSIEVSLPLPLPKLVEAGLAVFFPALTLLGAAAYSQVLLRIL